MSTAEAAPPVALADLAQAFALLLRVQLALEPGEERNHVAKSRWAVMRMACTAYGERAWATAWKEATSGQGSA